MASTGAKSKLLRERHDYSRFTREWVESISHRPNGKSGTDAREKPFTESEDAGCEAGSLTLEQQVMGRMTHISTSLGRCVCHLPVSKEIQNRYGTLHGGAIATLVDVVGTAALMTVIGPPGGVSTDINVSYISAAKCGAMVEVEGILLRAGKTLAVIEVNVRRLPDKELVAQGRHTKFLAISVGPQSKL